VNLGSLPERLPFSSPIGGLLRLPLRLIPKRAKVPVLSGINKGMTWVAGSSVHGCWLGTYEHAKQDAIKKFLRPGMKVFDIGANAGFYSLAFSRAVGNEGHVWAFEPLAENAANIMAHVEMNHVLNVTLVQAAVADRMGLTFFNVAESNSMGTVASEGSYMVPTLALDPMIEKGILPTPDLVKMDVEGAESDVLAGSKTLLQARKTLFFVACHGDEQKMRCIDVFRRHDFSLFELSGNPIHAGDTREDEIYAVPS
jgi:FkbM family methyltransferase